MTCGERYRRVILSKPESRILRIIGSCGSGSDEQPTEGVIPYKRLLNEEPAGTETYTTFNAGPHPRHKAMQ